MRRALLTDVTLVLIILCLVKIFLAPEPLNFSKTVLPDRAHPTNDIITQKQTQPSIPTPPDTKTEHTKTTTPPTPKPAVPTPPKPLTGQSIWKGREGGGDAYGVSGLYKSDVGYVALLADHGAAIIRSDSPENSGVRGTWDVNGDRMSITWNKHGTPTDTLTRRGDGWHIGRGGTIGPLSSRVGLDHSGMREAIGVGSLDLKLAAGVSEEDRPAMLYLGKCCESHWELTYISKCRDGPGCSSAPGVATDTAGGDLYHPSMSCDVPCVVHHDPLLPIDAVMTGGFVSRQDFYDDINRKRHLNNVPPVSNSNRPIAASMCLEPYWRIKSRATNKREMKFVDMIMSTHLNADIPLTRFSLLRLETDSYDWNNPLSWRHWSEYMELKGRRKKEKKERFSLS